MSAHVVELIGVPRRTRGLVGVEADIESPAADPLFGDAQRAQGRAVK